MEGSVREHTRELRSGKAQVSAWGGQAMKAVFLVLLLTCYMLYMLKGGESDDRSAKTPKKRDSWKTKVADGGSCHGSCQITMPGDKKIILAEHKVL
jgi:hypothetical protein